MVLFPCSSTAVCKCKDKTVGITYLKAVNPDAELTLRGIRVNCQSPGPIDTPLFDGLICRPSGRRCEKELRAAYPLGAHGTPEEVAKAGLFLATDDLSFVVGEEIKVGGGEGNLRI